MALEVAIMHLTLLLLRNTIDFFVHRDFIPGSSKGKHEQTFERRTAMALYSEHTHTH